jgi:hypothetical protein
MKVALVLAGQYRGDNSMIAKHKENVGDYDTYVSCLPKYFNDWNNSDWKPKEIYEVPMVNFRDTLWANHRNSCQADESGFWQFWNLKYVLENVPKNYDFYIKSRNDLVIESKLDIDFSKLRDDTYYYSRRTFNGIWPYINDQFWIGSKKIVYLISKFVDEFYQTPGSENVGKSNEHMLNWWILKNGYKTESFDNLFYSKNHNGITQCSGEIDKFFLE